VNLNSGIFFTFLIKTHTMNRISILLLISFLGLMTCQPSPEKAETAKAQTAETTNTIEAKLTELGITLPEVSPPIANYVNAVTTGKLVFLAGKGPKKADGTYITGKVGRDLSIEEGYAAARIAGITQLAALKAEIGNLDRVNRIVKVLGMVNATEDFANQPEVINGFSDLMVEVFGEKGKHARAAVGMGSLPRNIAVEIEMIVELK
jgi:enamine deaminase RidA (YjgF/YER057c/UK114 family)